MGSNYFWLLEAFIGIGALIGLQYGVKKIIAHTAKKETHGWRQRLGSIFQPPLTLLIWVLVILYFVDVIGTHTGFEIAIKYLDALRKTTVVGCSAWLCFRWKKEFEISLAAHPIKKVDHTTIRIVGRLVSIVVGVLTGLIVMQIFGVDIAPLLAFGSIGAASIGFAGKDVMANFCSGIMLQITRPFVEGDLIFLPEKHLEGHIEEIGWFRTSIRDKEKHAVYLPNNLFSTQLVVNISRSTHRHFKQIIKIPLNEVEKVDAAVGKVRETITQTPAIDTLLPIHVFLKNFGDYACEIEIDAYSTIIDQSEFNRFQQKLLLRIQADLAGMDLAMAIPVMSWKPIS
jgi:MscS family membrane protein